MPAYAGYTKDASGYASGGAVTTLRATLAYTDTTAKALFTIPAGAYITAWVINVTTAFNDSGTDLLDIGVSGTQQKFAASVDVSSTGLKSSGVVAAQIGAVQASAQAVTGLYTGQNSNASAGAATIMVQFYIP